MSEEIGKWVKVRTPKTVGELRDLLLVYADDVNLCFINGPREGLYAKVEDDGHASVGFQPDEGFVRFCRDPNNNDDGGPAKVADIMLECRKKGKPE